MTDDDRDAREETLSVESTLWLHGYEMIPPQPEQQISALRHMLDRENAEAKRTARGWTARLVTRHQATHVLIVSTSPAVDIELNRKLEAELKALGSQIVVTVPLPVRAEAGDT